MTTPDLSSIADYGVPAGGFQDGEGIAVVDPTTDQSGAAASAAFCDVAQMTRTADRCWARFVAGASPALAATNPHEAMWGNSAGVAPVVAHIATGQWTVTWPATVTDQLGNSHNVNLRKARVTVEGSTLGFAQCSVTSPNVVTVYGFSTAFAANDLTGITLLVEAS